jgi:hypothetical protein
MNAGLFAESTRVLRISQPDGREVGAGSAKGLFLIAQLRDVLATKDSSVVPEEDQHRRSRFP